jgi:predicted DNA-binding protein
MVRMSFFLPEKLIGALKLRSEETGLTVSDLIRRAIEQYLPKRKA